MPDDALMTVTRDQKRWSVTANALKKSIDGGRVQVFALAVVGAVLETGAAQLPGTQNTFAKVLGFIGAAALAVMAVLRPWKLGHEQMQAWILARAAAESFKREMFLYRTAAGPYVSGNPKLTLLDRRDEILKKVLPVQKYVVEVQEEPKEPGPLDLAGYLEQRVNGQIAYFTKNASRYATVQKQFNAVQISLAVVGALLGTALTMSGQQAYGAWVAVITTVSGTIAAYVLAKRYEQLTANYRAAADQLTGAVSRWKADGTRPASELIERCEAVLLQENQGWIAGADQTAAPAPAK